jgi:hypothetical protein
MEPANATNTNRNPGQPREPWFLIQSLCGQPAISGGLAGVAYMWNHGA